MNEDWVTEDELAKVKPFISQKVQSVLGFADDAVVASAVNCWTRKLDRKTIASTLSEFLEDKADGFVESVYQEVNSLRAAKKAGVPSKRLLSDLPPLRLGDNRYPGLGLFPSTFREKEERSREKERRDKDRNKDGRDSRDSKRDSHRRDRDEKDRDKDRRGDERSRADKERKDDRRRGDKDDKRRSDDHDEDRRKRRRDASPEGEKTKSRRFDKEPSGKKGPIDPEAIKARIQVSQPHYAASNAQSVLNKEKERELDDLKAKIKQSLRNVPITKDTKALAAAPLLMVDEQGNEIIPSHVGFDALLPSNIFQTSRVHATILINKKQQRAKAGLKIENVPAALTDPKKNPFFDPRLPASRGYKKRGRREIKFFEEGTFVKKAQRLRAEAIKDSLVGEADAAAGEKKADGDRAKRADKVRDPVPVVEWWDTLVVAPHPEDNTLYYGENFEDRSGLINPEHGVHEAKITHLVEHPIPIQPPHEPKNLAPLPMMLTKEERKKLRKRNRMERQREQNEKQLLGLVPAPPPKVKISNMMRVLTAEAVLDPTEIERRVREQMAARLQAHDDRNQARKLTPEEKKEKKKKKLQEEMSSGLTASVYKVRDLTHPKLRFKVEKNASQAQMTGCVLFCGGQTMIVVEGGPKTIRKYKKLMLQRIQWDKPVDDEEDGAPKENGEAKEPTSKIPNKCELVWEGASFKNFRFESFENENQARKFLQDRGIGHYWDYVKNWNLDREPY